MNCQTVHIAVTDLEAGIRFYSTALGFAPEARDARHAWWRDTRSCLEIVISTHTAPMVLP